MERKAGGGEEKIFTREGNTTKEMKEVRVKRQCDRGERKERGERDREMEKERDRGEREKVTRKL
jgi:hypothetical protein